MLSTAPIGLPPHTHRPHALVQACRAVLRARKLIPAVAALAGLGGHALADSLTTTYAGGNGHRGNMFDVTSTELIEITGLQLNLMNAVTDYQVFYRVGTWIGNATSSAGWTLLQSGTATGSVVGPSDLITLNTPLAIASGQSYAFYVTSTNRSISLDYTNGTSTGAVAATDGVLTIYQGAGLEYAFGQGGSVLEPRIWNGTVYYETPNNFYWTGQADGRWSGANWFTNTGGALPGATNGVVFSANGAANRGTTLDADVAIQSLTINDTNPITIGGSHTLTIDNEGGAEITVNNGTNLGINADVALNGTVAEIAVKGSGAMEINGDLMVENTFAKSGSGKLTLTGTSTTGGVATIEAGTLAVTGAAASLILPTDAAIQIGTSGPAVLQLSNGAHLTTGDGDIGAGASGSAILTGVSTLWNGHYVTVGRASTGDLQILNGATVSDVRGFVGSFNSGAATVRGGNAQWLNESALLVGFGAGSNGTLTVADSGIIKAPLIEMGNGGGTGAILVSGSDESGRGVLETGEILKQGGTTTIDFDGGQIRPTRNEPNFFNGFSAGDITLGPGGVVISSGYSIGINADLDGVGGLIKQGAGTLTIGGSNTFAGDIELYGGALFVSSPTPFASTGTLAIADGRTFGVSQLVDATINNPTLVLGDIRLSVEAATLTFTGEVQLGNDTRSITLMEDSLVDFAGPVTGTAGLTIQAEASFSQPIVEMTGASSNTYPGLTRVGSGAGLHIHKEAGAVAIAGDLQIDAGALVAIEDAGGATMQLAPTSNVTVNGELHFGGSNGDFAQTMESLNGSGLITNDGPGGNYALTLTVNSGNFAGVIRESLGSGTMNLIKAGPGTLTLSGANTYGGGTTLQGGVLSISSNANLGAPAGALRFNGGTLHTVGSFTMNRPTALESGGGTIDTAPNTKLIHGGEIGGSGGLTKIGAGILALTGTNPYTGDTIVDAGTLIVDGYLASANTIVNVGAFLGGDGTFNGALVNNGAINPGNSPGTLSLGGNFTQSSKGTLTIEVGGLNPGEFDRLEVEGSAQLDGTLRLIRLNNFQLRPGNRIAFLTAAGGVTGKFATVENEFATGTIVSGRVVYRGKAVLLEGAQRRFTQVPDLIDEEFPEVAKHRAFENQGELTHNQHAAASALDSIVKDDGETRLIRYLNGRLLPELPGDFDRIAPEELTAIYQTSFSLAQVQGLNLQRRAEEIRAGSVGFSARGFAIQGNAAFSANLATTPSSLPIVAEGKESKVLFDPVPDNRWGVFISGTGEWGDVDSDDNASGYDFRTGGLTVGLDYRVSENFAMGLSIGYANTRADLVDDGRVRVNGGQLGIYATYFTGGFYSDFAISGGYRDYDTKRSALEGTASGNTDGGEFDALIGTGYNFKFGALTVGPTATLEYTYLGLDGFDEDGSLAPLRFPDQSGESIRTTLGIKASYDWKVGRVLVRPELRAAWQHEFGDDDYTLDADFVNSAGNVFSVNGPSVGRDSLLLGASVAVQLNERASIYLSYDGQLLRENYELHAISAGLRLTY